MAGTEPTARPGDVRRITEILRPILLALERAGSVLQAAEDLQGDVATRENQIAGMKSEAAEIERKLGGLRTQYAELDGKLEDERAQLAEGTRLAKRSTDEALAKFKRDVAAAEAEATAAKGRIARSVAAAEDSAEKKLKDLEAKRLAALAKIDADVAAAETRLEGLNEALADLKKKF